MPRPGQAFAGPLLSDTLFASHESSAAALLFLILRAILVKIIRE
jgi:hypothetical protein